MSLPGVVTRVAGAMVEVEREGRRAWFNALLQPGLVAGDTVVTHAGLVVGVIGPAGDADPPDRGE